MNIGANRPSFRLRRFFSIASAIAIAVFTALLAFAYHFSELNEHTKLAGMRNELLARTYANTLWPRFGDFLLSQDIPVGERPNHPETAKLHERFRQMSRDVPVVKLKVYSVDGVAVYSSVLAEIGENKRGNPAFQLARQGELVNELTHRGTMSASEGTIENVDVVSTYIPIRLSADGPVTAVFELYSNVTDALNNIKVVTIRLLFVLFLAFLLLYGSLLLIINHADRTLNRQYQALAENEARLMAKTAELEREITERKEIEEALRRSEESAAAANRAKSEFLSGMSHELRTPMNAILGFAQLLETEPEAPLNADQSRFVKQILKAGAHLLELINEVLDLARIEAGKMALSIERVDLGTLLENALPLVEALAGQRNVDIAADDLSALSVRADHTRLKQVLLNLLSNAIKYNRVGGKVKVEARAEGGIVRLSVADTGPGIPEARMAELFQPFSRLGVQSAEVEGTGIGLVLSRRLTEAMDGRIGVDNHPGQGCTFWLELPQAPAAATQPDTTAKTLAAESVTAPAPDRKTILYIEDNPANLMLMEEIVRRMGNTALVSAPTAELGLGLASIERPDLVVLDINLPGMDGFAALKALRAQPQTAAIPAIAVSANVSAAEVRRGLAAGFLRYHTKPIDIEELLVSLQTCLGKAS